MTKGTVMDNVSELNIRNAASTAPGTDTGANLYAKDAVYGTVLGSWIAFDAAYRYNEADQTYTKELFSAKRYAAIQNPSNASQKYMVLTNETEPVPPDPEPPVPSPIKPFIISISGEDHLLKITNQTSASITIEISPK